MSEDNGPRRITACPMCDSPVQVTELTCEACLTRLHGRFPQPALARLAQEQQEFVTVFVRCRGIIRDVERVLGVSYPTVRARLDTAVDALERILAEDATGDTKAHQRDLRRRDLLRQVEAGLIQPEQAAAALRRL